MQKADSKQFDLPSTPGVYRFLSGKEILYIGKATSLKERVRSYFGEDLLDTRGPLLVKMLTEATTLTWEETDSVLEALILEANLIKKYQPIYNTKEKSNKSFNYVLITKEAFPRILTVRERELLTAPESIPVYEDVFGPFPNGSALREALKVIRKIFPYRDTCEPHQGKPCFNRQIGLCPGVCSGDVSVREYQETIRHIRLLFAGKKQTLIKTLTSAMKQCAKGEQFEMAGSIRNQIYALEHINDIALTKGEVGKTLSRIEGFDVAHISETHRVGVMVVSTDGDVAKSEYRKFKIRTDESGDIAALKELLTRRLAHEEWDLPNLIVVDGGKAQVNAARRILQSHELAIPIVGVVKDDHHKPKAILGDKALARIHEAEILKVNAEAHRFAVKFHQKLRNTI